MSNRRLPDLDPASLSSPAMPPQVVMFGSGRPVTCAIMDYARRLCETLNKRQQGFAALRVIEPDRPFAFVEAIVASLRQGGIVHLQLPVEGWGNHLLPGSALMAARLATRQGLIAITLHEWTSLHHLRYLSTIPDILAADGFMFVSPQQRDAFLRTPLVSRAKKQMAPVVPIGPNIMPAQLDPDRLTRERLNVRGSGPKRAEIVIGFFGVLYASKRPDLLLHVVTALRNRGVMTRLLVCGDFLWDKPRDRDVFFALVDELQLTDWVDFRGRIDDEIELMTTLAAADVFLMPFSDGISVRRGSFQAVSQLAIPLVSTEPDRTDEFSLSPTLKSKIDNAATVLCPIGSTPDTFAEAILRAHAHKDEAIGVDLAQSWDDAATAHIAFYEDLKRTRML